jgi:SAM-dependent methyltransferase
MDVRAFNREAWNRQVAKGNPWTVPVSAEVIAAARDGIWSVLLTPTKPTPRTWFPELKGQEVLCLASGGGQQGPILSAAGAHVTVFDNSPRQLEQDRQVAKREGLDIRLVEGDMADLSLFSNEQFDLIFHPVSNVFVPDVHPVWREAYRVLKAGGALLAGFTNPLLYLFDPDLLEEKGELQIRYSIPYSDLESLSEEKMQLYRENGFPLEFSHTLEEQIGGQLEAGFLLAGFFEDIDPTTVLRQYIPSYLATRALKMKR